MVSVILGVCGTRLGRTTEGLMFSANTLVTNFDTMPYGLLVVGAAGATAPGSMGSQSCQLRPGYANRQVDVNLSSGWHGDRACDYLAGGAHCFCSGQGWCLFAVSAPEHFKCLDRQARKCVQRRKITPISPPLNLPTSYRLHPLLYSQPRLLLSEHQAAWKKHQHRMRKKCRLSRWRWLRQNQQRRPIRTQSRLARRPRHPKWTPLLPTRKQTLRTKAPGRKRL